MRHRPPAFAGSWYPADPAVLEEEVRGYLQARRRIDGRPVALIAPHAGYRYSGSIAGQAYSTLEGHRFRRVLLLAPSHRAYFEGASVPDASHYATPLGSIPLDRAALDQLCRTGAVRSLQGVHDDEHSDELQLPFLQLELGHFELLPVLLGEAGPEDLRRLGAALRPLADRDTLVVASSDFTHYGRRFDYEPFPGDARLWENLAELDGGAVEAILARNVAAFLAHRERTGITACGFRPIAVLMHLLPAAARGHDLAYATSGEMTGDRQHSVSYRAVAFDVPDTPETLHAADEELLLRLARRAVQAAARGEPAPAVVEASPALSAPRACFVTLRTRSSGRLRGCIGNLVADRPLWSSVVEEAIAAATRDTRFPVVTPEEVDSLALSISVTTPLVPMSPEEVVPGRHGVCVTRAGRRGVLLPQVARELGWSREELLRGVCEKAGLSPEDWELPDAELRGFEALVFGELTGPGEAGRRAGN